MRRLGFLFGFLLTLLAPAQSFAFDVPDPDGTVTDLTGTLTAHDDARIEGEIARYRRLTGHQLGVLLLGSLDGEPIEGVAYQTFNTWGVGRKHHDDGVLLVVALSDRRMRIETGKGIGDRLTDVASHHVLRDILAPRLRDGRVRIGIEEALGAIEAEIDASDARSSATPPSSPSRDAWLPPALILAGIFVGIPLAFMLLLAFYSRPRRRFQRGSEDVSGLGVDASTPWISGGDSGSSFTSFSDGGGGGDFGGGDSGGGGASDSY